MVCHNEINLIFNLILSRNPEIFIELFYLQNNSFFNFIDFDYLKKTFLLIPIINVDHKYKNISRKTQLYTFENFRKVNLNKPNYLF